MGLDIRPMGKPKPGFEERYKELSKILQRKEKRGLSLADKLNARKKLSKEELFLALEWFRIQIKSYETIRAPRVGRDQEADSWLRQKYRETDQELSETEFLRIHDGYYVIELAKEKDGLPVYRSLKGDANVFNGALLTSCADLIGQNLVREAQKTKTAKETLDYGRRLMKIADKIAGEKKLLYLKDQREQPEANTEALESKLHIIFSLGRWLIFYGERGHGVEVGF
jgi:hypothetical protein